VKYGNYIIDEDSNSSVSKIVKAIKDKSNVIELGSSHGYILKYLKDHKQCTVHGYDIDPKAVDLANDNEITTSLIDLDTITIDFFESLPVNIDYIICADVLEHLKKMTNVISFISLYLKKNKNCRLLVSFPNITYYGVVDQLLHGNFKYSDLGILDNTHLRFYDKYELEKVFNNKHLEINSINYIDINPKDSEFNTKLDDKVVDILEQYNNENYLTYQYVIELQYSLDPIIKLHPNKPKKSIKKDFADALNNQIIKLNEAVNLKDAQVIELNEAVNLKDAQVIELNKLAHKQQDDINYLQQQIKMFSVTSRIKSFLGINKK